MSNRVIVAELTGRQRDAVHAAAMRLQKCQQEARRIEQEGTIALRHFQEILAASTGEDPVGLGFEPATGVVFRPADEVDDG